MRDASRARLRSLFQPTKEREKAMTMADTNPEGFSLMRMRSFSDEGSVASSLLSARTDIPGQRVCDALGEDIGYIDDVLLDAFTGKAVFVLLHIGGVFGFGGVVVPVPYERFRYDATYPAFITDISRHELESAPEVSEDWAQDLDVVRSLNEHYGRG